MSDDLARQYIRITNEGVAIGVLFNSSESRATREKMNDRTCHVDDPNLINMVRLEIILREHLQEFGDERRVFVCASHPRKSQFDVIFRLPSMNLAKEYIFLARNDFPNYSFIYVNHPTENPLKGKKYKLI